VVSIFKSVVSIENPAVVSIFKTPSLLWSPSPRLAVVSIKKTQVCAVITILKTSGLWTYHWQVNNFTVQIAALVTAAAKTWSSRS
jgi:hypothetical protein